jgi:two-component system, cell cycle response regulator
MPRQPEDEERDEDRTAIGDLTAIKVANRRDRAHLIVLAGGSLGQMFRVDKSETVIGRAADTSIRLEDDGVSRRHARVVQEGSEVWIEDLDSANGTFVNEDRIVRRQLHDGDKIQMGSTTILKFTYGDELEESFQQKMYDAALHDGLTGAFNKRHFLDRVPAEIAYARRHRTPLTLLMFDVDHFKQVNDRYGHIAGDYVLAQIAQIVTGTLRAEDLFARYGGEEFAVLCRGVPIEKASVLAERIRAKVETFLFEHHGHRIPVTVSIGVALFVDHAEAVTQLVADADAALYAAKRAGRNCVVAATT